MRPARANPFAALIALTTAFSFMMILPTMFFRTPGFPYGINMHLSFLGKGSTMENLSEPLRRSKAGLEACEEDGGEIWLSVP